jgi:hypothetical protein
VKRLEGHGVGVDVDVELHIVFYSLLKQLVALGLRLQLFFVLEQDSGLLDEQFFIRLQVQLLQVLVGRLHT